MNTFGTVKNKLENVRMALQLWRVRSLSCGFLENHKKRWEKNTLRIKYVVYVAVSCDQQVTLEMHAEMRVSSRKMSFIAMTKLVVPNG
jgi:hypothetical protein